MYRLLLGGRTAGATVRHFKVQSIRWYSLPFNEDLDAVDNELFGLEDFQHYKESPDLQPNTKETPKPIENTISLEEVASRKEPMIFISKETDPYLNLAIEDYVYNKMPLSSTTTYNRLMFYVNSPCVVIGKNQNPWKEVNLPLLNSLHIPLLRRRSGGGTVVHDSGNVNFSFMTTKNEFSRFKFVNLIVDAVNQSGEAKYKLEVNDRGDITTVKQPDGINYKISGSAYKLSKGKSYHHGTMLLNSKLDILGKLLHTTETKNGIIIETKSINSVKSKVANIELGTESFHHIVSNAFKQQYGIFEELTPEEKEYNTMLGLDDFMESKQTQIFVIDKGSSYNEEILQTAQELKQWHWKYGNTPQFSHVFYNDKYGLTVKFVIGKEAKVEDFSLEVEPRLLSKEKIEESFEFLRMMVDKQEMEYKGSDIAGFVTNDELSDWLGESIDGSV